MVIWQDKQFSCVFSAINPLTWHTFLLFANQWSIELSLFIFWWVLEQTCKHTACLWSLVLSFYATHLAMMHVTHCPESCKIVNIFILTFSQLHDNECKYVSALYVFVLLQSQGNPQTLPLKAHLSSIIEARNTSFYWWLLANIKKKSKDLKFLEAGAT